MTQEELIAQLAPIRIPVEFAEFTLQDALLALALGIVVGLLLSRLIGAITARKDSPFEFARDEIDRLTREVPSARLLGLAALLKRYAPDAIAKLGLDQALYDPSQTVDLEQIETAILTAAKNGRDA